MTVRKFFLKHQGHRYFDGKKALLSKAYFVLKEHAAFENQDKANLSRLMIEFVSNMERIRLQDDYVDHTPESELNAFLNPKDYTEINDIALYKFTPRSSYENYISKGVFQFGSLEHYRTIEKMKSRDAWEGFVNVFLQGSNRLVYSPIISGYNCYAFCGTDSLENRDLHENKFGNTIIKIPSLRSFATHVKKLIGAENFYIGRINYSDLKIAHIDAPTMHFDIEHLDDIMNDQLFELIYSQTLIQSAFTKPILFQPENEIRLVFEMPKESNKKYERAHDIDLLQYAEIIQP